MSISLTLPLSAAAVRSLRLNQQVRLSGRIYTARDAVHKFLVESCQAGDSRLPDLCGAVLYHCGPVMIRSGSGDWQVTAAGPTTSSREEPYMAEIIRRFGIRGIIGKGGMGSQTAQACRECGCVYLHAVGGAAQILAARVTRVPEVRFLEEFGFPEAMWTLEVTDFPAVVTLDAAGNSLHERIRQESERRLVQAAACSPASPDGNTPITRGASSS